MSAVFGIDPKHPKNVRKLSRAIKPILLDKTISATGEHFYVTRKNFERLQRAFEAVNPVQPWREQQFLKQMRAAKRRQK